MSALAWSTVLLWIVVTVQAVMIVAILRYLGTSVLGAGAFASGEGPPVRTRPPRVPMANLRGESVALDDPGSTVRHIFFLSTTCKVCRHVVQALRDLRSSLPAGSDLFVIHGEADDIRTMATEERLDPGAVVPDPGARVFRTWDVIPRPFVVALDENGLVKDRGRPDNPDRLRELVAPLPTSSQAQRGGKTATARRTPPSGTTAPSSLS